MVTKISQTLLEKHFGKVKLNSFYEFKPVKFMFIEHSRNTEHEITEYGQKYLTIIEQSIKNYEKRIR